MTKRKKRAASAGVLQENRWPKNIPPINRLKYIKFDENPLMPSCFSSKMLISLKPWVKNLNSNKDYVFQIRPEHFEISEYKQTISSGLKVV